MQIYKIKNVTGAQLYHEINQKGNILLLNFFKFYYFRCSVIL